MLRCTGRAYPSPLIRARLRRPGLLIWHFPDPAYPDSSYYVDVARQLHAGHGFNVDFIWIFAEVGGKIPADPTLPIPSNAHWMPLASIVQVPFLALFGDVAWAAALPFALIGAHRGAADLGDRARRRRAAVRVGRGRVPGRGPAAVDRLHGPARQLLALPAAGHRGLLDGGARACAARVGRSWRPDCFAGLATLARNDGLLVLAALGIVFAWDRWRSWRAARAGRQPRRSARRPISLAAAVGCVAVFVLVMAPWWARQLAVFGSLSPSTASGKVLFIRDIGEWNSITTPASLDHLLGMGIGPLIETRIGGAIAAVTIFVTLVVRLRPRARSWSSAAWARAGARPTSRPFFVYAALLFAFSALVSAVHVPGGTFIHSAVALAPYSYILALEGIVLAVGWVAARRSAWDADAAVPRSSAARRRRSRSSSPSRGRSSVHADLVGAARRLPGRRGGARRRGRRRPATGSCRSTRPAPVLDGPRRRRPGQRPARHDPRGRTRLRHPLARPRPRRRGPGRGADPRRRPSTRPGSASRSSPRASPTRLAVYPVLAHAMTRREALLTAAGIFVVALLVRIAVAGQIVFPKPEDTAYYFGVARNLVEGRGLVSDALWSYQTPPLEIPRAGVRGLAAAAVVPGGDPDGDPRRDVRGGPVVGDPHGRGRAGPRLAAGGRRRGRTRPVARSGPGRSRSGRA